MKLSSFVKYTSHWFETIRFLYSSNINIVTVALMLNIEHFPWYHSKKSACSQIRIKPKGSYYKSKLVELEQNFAS